MIKNALMGLGPGHIGLPPISSLSLAGLFSANLGPVADHGPEVFRLLAWFQALGYWPFFRKNSF